MLNFGGVMKHSGEIMIFHLHLDFPEIAGEFPSKQLPFGGVLGRVFGRYMVLSPRLAGSHGGAHGGAPKTPAWNSTEIVSQKCLISWMMLLKLHLFWNLHLLYHDVILSHVARKQSPVPIPWHPGWLMKDSLKQREISSCMSPRHRASYRYNIPN